MQEEDAVHKDAEQFEARSLRGREVVAIRDGKVIGRVRNLVFDPLEHRLLGALVSRSWRKQGLFLPSPAIRRLGPHAVTTDHEASLEPIEAHPRAANVLASGIRLEGTPVMLQDGARIAIVRAVWMNNGLSIVRYDAVQGIFPFERRLHVRPEQVTVIGPDAMVLEADPRPSAAQPAG